MSDLPGAPEITSYAVENGAATLHWQMVNDGGNIIVFYNLHFVRDGIDETVVQVHGEHYRADSLVDGSSYEAFVYAVTDAAVLSPKSNSVFFQIEGDEEENAGGTEHEEQENAGGTEHEEQEDAEQESEYASRASEECAEMCLDAPVIVQLVPEDNRIKVYFNLSTSGSGIDYYAVAEDLTTGQTHTSGFVSDHWEVVLEDLVNCRSYEVSVFAVTRDALGEIVRCSPPSDSLQVMVGAVGCFLRGTRVLLSNGSYRPIEEIQVNDHVAMDLHGTRSACVKRVDHQMYPATAQTIPFCIMPAEKNNMSATNANTATPPLRPVFVSPQHALACADGKWREAQHVSNAVRAEWCATETVHYYNLELCDTAGQQIGSSPTDAPFVAEGLLAESLAPRAALAP